MDATGILWMVMAIFLVISAIFSASETALSFFNRIRMKGYASDGSKRANRVLNLGRNYNNVLTAILIGNNIVNIGTSVIGTVVFTAYLGPAGAGVATAVVTVLVLVFGEVMPKSFASQHADSVAMLFSGFIRVVTWVLTPFVFLFSKLQKLVSRFKSTDAQPSVTEQELKVIIEEIEDEGVLEGQESRLVRSALDFDETTVERVLTPRVDLVAFEIGTDAEEIKETFLAKRFSRIPVYEKHIDNIVGILYEKDFFRAYLSDPAFSIQDHLHKPLFVPPSAKISELLQLIQKHRTHMVIVADQYGGVEGVITLEDIIEKLVGEIYDIGEEEDPDIQMISGNRYRVNPDMDVQDFLETMHLSSREFETESTTVGGWVLEQFERLPKQGERFDFENLTVTVEALDDKRMTSLLVQVNRQNPQSAL